MSAEFAFPAWAADEPPPSPPEVAPTDPQAVDPHRIEGLVNGFIAAKQDALFTAPDAFYRRTGADAVDGAPTIVARLSGLRDATLGRADGDHEREALGPRLDAHMADALDGIDRHVAQQRDVRNRQIISERQALIQRAAELEHNNDDKLSGLVDAHAGAALELARMTGEPEGPAIQAARSAVWRTAIGQRLATGQGPQALSLFEQVKDQLVPADERALDVPILTARTDGAADAWIARETPRQGEPLSTRVQADPDLSPVEKAIILAKVEARDSAQESARIATVKGLDDRLDATSRMLATQTATYKPGTFATIADAYDAAGEHDQAAAARRVALQEPFLLSFATSSAAAQQPLIDALPEDAQATAKTIQRQQAEAFAKDAFTAGTALYPVGPPVPIDDREGRITQARTIAAYRGIPVAPFTADEIATMRRELTDGTPQEQAQVVARVQALPVDMKAAIAPSRTMSDGVDVPPRPGDQLAEATPDEFRRQTRTLRLSPEPEGDSSGRADGL